MIKINYTDNQISDREIMIAVPSMVIGIGVLTLPKDLATTTMFADGWIVIIIGGLIAILFTWLAAKIAVSFPQQSFLNYATTITTRNIAIVLTWFMSLLWICYTAFEIRKLADITMVYLFEEIPIEIVALIFFLVVIYAVSGPSVGLLRLNMLFFPIILFISIIIVVFNLPLFDFGNMLPMFETNPVDYISGTRKSILSFSGFSIVLFYIAFVKKPKKTAKMAAFGMLIPIGLYLLLFITAICVFGHSATKNLIYPTIELAKVVDIPGGVLERFESIFFVIWIMAIFNTTAMAFDVAVLAMNSIFKNIKKMTIILILAPIVYLISMLPKDMIGVDTFITYLSTIHFLYVISIIIGLTILMKFRRVNQID